MPRAEKHEIAGNRKINRETHSPYNQSGRKVKKTSTGSWSPSIWNFLTFWKSADTSQAEDEDDGYDGDLPTDDDETSISLNHNNTVPTVDEDGDYNMPSLNISNLSEEQVIASLTRSPRHVHFQLPNGDQERLDGHYSQSRVEIPVRHGGNTTYVAPLPPSSPLHHSGSPQDPLAKVSEYLDNVVRPRGGECTDVEALGLSILIQSSVNQSGPQHATPSNLNPFLLPKMKSGPPSASSSPSSVRPMFTNRSTDIDAVLASSPGASGSMTSTSNGLSTCSPTRTLRENPNGSLYYQGGGSARSRYRSPAFGSPGRKKVSFPRHFGEAKSDASSANGVVQTPSPSDGKRRRVGEEKDSSVARASGSHPVAPNGTNTPLRATVTSTPAPRFGTSVPASRLLASTPARPSPLRQSIRADSISPASSSAGSVNGASPRSKPSRSDGEGRSRASEKASEIMAGIINDATPKDSVPDIRNPYQPSSRNPTKRSRRAPVQAPRPLPRPSRQSNSTPSSPQPKVLSALEIIQRTAPQAQTGSKRSHTGMPPPKSPAPVNGKVNPAAPIQTGSNALKPVVIELDEDEDQLQGPPPKRPKSEQPHPSNAEKNMQVYSKPEPNVDIEDVDMEVTIAGSVSRPAEVVEFDKGTESQEAQAQQQQEMKRPVFTGPFMKGAATTRFQSAPKEPSPLRQSFQPDMPPSSPENSTRKMTSLPSTSSSGSSPPLVSTSSSPFAQTFAPSPAPAPAPPHSASLSTPSPFTSASAPSAVASTSAPSPLAQTSTPSTSTSTSSPFTATQAAASSALTTAAATSPYGFMSTSPFAPKSAASPFGVTLAASSAKDVPPSSVDDAIPAPANLDAPVPSTSTPLNPPSASTDVNIDLVALAKKQVLEVPVSLLPTFTFAFTTNPSFLSEYADRRDATLAISPTELPKFDFVGRLVPAPVVTPTLAPKVEIKTFDWDKVGISRPKPVGWKCGLCSCLNTDGSSKCSVCAEIKP